MSVTEPQNSSLRVRKSTQNSQTNAKREKMRQYQTKHKEITNNEKNAKKEIESLENKEREARNQNTFREKTKKSHHKSKHT
jgi:hypothetical protein